MFDSEWLIKAFIQGLRKVRLGCFIGIFLPSPGKCYDSGYDENHLLEINQISPTPPVSQQLKSILMHLLI